MKIEHAQIVVDYDLSLFIAMQEGDYQYGLPRSCKFDNSYSGCSSVEVQIFDFEGEFLRASAILEILESAGLRPAELRELLALGAQYPEKQREGPIVALSANDEGEVAYLAEILDEREVNSCFSGLDEDNPRARFDWPPQFRFLAVPK